MLRHKTRTGTIHQDEEKGADWQGKISFEKRVTVSTSAALSVPAWFVHRHGDKVQKFLILQCEGDGQLWTVEVKVYFPHGRPQATFQRGWKGFAAFYGLVEGDRLTFTLVAKSKFTVSILRTSENNSKPWGPSLQTLIKPNLKPQLRARFLNLTKCNDCNKRLFVKNGAAAVELAHSVAADSSLSYPSDMDAHFFEPLLAAAPRSPFS